MIITASNRDDLQDKIIKKVDDFLKPKIIIIQDDSMTSMDDRQIKYFKPSDVRDVLQMVFDDTYDSAKTMDDEWMVFDENNMPDRIHQRFICQKQNGIVVELEWRQYENDKEKFGFFYRDIDQTAQILFYRPLPRARTMRQ